VLDGGTDGGVIGTLAHHTEQGLGPREAHKDAPACLCKYLLSLANGALEVRLCKQSLSLTWRHRHRALELRVEWDRIGHLPYGDPCAGYEPEYGDRAEEPIAGR
jgi:hypothetical protein